MGARAALLHAIQTPKRWDALILISANPGIENENERSERRRHDATLASQIETGGLDAFLDYWQKTPLIQSQKNIRPTWLKAMRHARREHSTTGLANSLRQFGQGSVPNLWPRIEQLNMPICLITGALDKKYTQIAKRLHQLPSLNTAHSTIEGASHMPQLEQAEASIKVIQNFLAKAYSKTN
jgi:2-succinyl-6-hydroxy-2,4-cyclohexadiene-1-carboxylate synthase